MYTISIRNMTLVNSQEICIYSDESVIEAYKIESASLNLEEGSAGSLNIKLPATNVGHDEFETFATQVIVRKNGSVYWIGRLLEIQQDFYKNLDLTFEGALNYTVDTIFPHYHKNTTITDWINTILGKHNTIVTETGELYKRIAIGYLDPNINTGSTTDLYSEDETVQALLANVFEGWECHPRIRYTHDAVNDCYLPILDVYKTYNQTAPLPQISFGLNLADYSSSVKNEEMATVVIPRGATYSDDDRAIAIANGIEDPNWPADLDMKRTVYSVNNHDEHLYDTPENLARYGYICKILEYDDIESPAELKAAGEKYLLDQVWDKTTFNFSAIDMNLFDYNNEEISVGRMVHVLSEPHGLDYNYPCTAMTVDILEPGRTTYTLGYKDDRHITEANRSTDEKLKEAVRKNIEREKVLQQNIMDDTGATFADLQDDIDRIEEEAEEGIDSVRTFAKQNTLQLLNIWDQTDNPRLKGQVHFKKEVGDDSKEHITEIVISDRENYMDPNAKNWRWNQSGLYFIDGAYTSDPIPSGSPNPYAYQNLKIGITNDGQIVADNITAGTFNADIIGAGVIRSREHGIGSQDANFQLNMQDGVILGKKGTLYFNGLRKSDGTESRPDQPTKDFAYFSNQEIGRYTAVAGERKDDWMMIVGNTFGVDSSGRAYMSEGVIGATGSVFDVVANNTSFVKCSWVQTSFDETTRRYVGELKWTVEFNTDASRPYIPSGTADNEMYYFRFRLARYDSNDNFVFMTGMNSFKFDMGTSPERYNRISFSSPITIDTTLPEGQDEPDIPYYEGQIFPLWYHMNDSGTNPDYTEGDHRYFLDPVGYSNVIKIEGYADAPLTEKPKRKVYTGARQAQNIGSNAGAVNIGPGYLSNGTFGNYNSFYLGGLTRHTTLLNHEDDWKLTVGSRFGVTDAGNVYCVGMTANNLVGSGATLNYANVSGTINASTLTVNSITNMNLVAKNPLDDSSYFTPFNYYVRTSDYSTGIFHEGTVFNFYIDTTKSSVAGYFTNLPFNPIFNVTASLWEYYQDTHGNPPRWEFKAVGNFTFTYDKTSTPGYIQTVTVDTSDWNTPDPDWNSTGQIRISITMQNPSSKFIFGSHTQIKSIDTDPGGDANNYLEGYFNTDYLVTDQFNDAVSCAVDFIGSGHMLGGPHRFWTDIYVRNVHQTTSGTVGSSIKYKKDVESLDLRYEDLFDRLRPIRYRLKDDDSKYHMGLIMEELGEAIDISKLKPEEVAAYVPSDDRDGGGIAYGEFISLLIWEVQKLKTKVSKLERQLYEAGIIDID